MSNEINLRADGSLDQTIVDLGKDWLGTAISGGTIGFAESMMTVDGEGSAADDLATITNGATGKLLALRIADASRVITLKHDVGNLWLPSLADEAIGDVNRVVLLLYNGTVWTMKAPAAAAAGALVAAFEYSANALTVQFTDVSTGTPTSWDWNYGDGSAHGTTQDPSHVFSAAGYYYVTLTVEDADSNISFITRLVQVAEGAWQQEFDFRNGLHDWVLSGEAMRTTVGGTAAALGVYSSGVGFEDSYGERGVNTWYGEPPGFSMGLRGMTVQHALPGTAHLRRVYYFGKITPGTATTPSQVAWAKRLELLGGTAIAQTNTFFINIPTISSTYYLTTQLPDPTADIDQVAAWLLSAEDDNSPFVDGGGSVTLEGAVLYGPDDQNPYGENNVSDRLVVTQQPTDAAEDAVISPSITLQAWNRWDVLVNPGASQVTVTLGDNPGGATLGGTTTKAFSLGVVTFNDLTISEPGTGYTLLFEVTSLDSGTPYFYGFKPLSVESDPFDVT